MLWVRYDEEYDVLYLADKEPVPSYSDEVAEGILFRYSYESDRPSGVTILDYKGYWKNRMGEWLDKIADFLGYPIDDLNEAIDCVVFKKASFA